MTEEGRQPATSKGGGMSEYTLTTALMREWHVRSDHAGNKSRAEYEAEFDRWLNQVRADAIREVADAWAVREGVSWFTPFASSVNWLNEYADKIERGEL